MDETARHLRRRELNSACSERDGTAAAFGAWRTDSRPATAMLMTGPRRTVRFFVQVLYSYQGIKRRTNHGNKTRRQTRGHPFLSEEVPYQITLIGLSQGSVRTSSKRAI